MRYLVVGHVSTSVSGRMNAELIRILQTEEFLEKVLNTGNEPVGLGLSAFQPQ